MLHDEEISHEEIRLEYLKTIFGDFRILYFKGRKSLNFEKFGFLNITQREKNSHKKLLNASNTGLKHFL